MTHMDLAFILILVGLLGTVVIWANGPIGEDSDDC